MSRTSGQNGKGSSRRKEDSRKVRDNWDSIDWTKKPAPPAPNDLDSKPQT